MKIDKPSADISPVRGRVNVRFNPKRNTYRLRFNSVHADQLELIQDALARAREELPTMYDVVALDAICIGYLGGTFGLIERERSRPGD